MNDRFSLIRDIFGAREYEARCALIERNLDQIDENFVDASNAILKMEGFSPPEKLVLAYLCARTLSHASSVHAKQGNMQDTRRVAALALQAFQRAFYLPNEIDVGECTDMTKSHLDVLLAYANELCELGLEEERWQAYWIADPIFEAVETLKHISLLPEGQRIVASMFGQLGEQERAKKARQGAQKQEIDDKTFRPVSRLLRAAFTLEQVGMQERAEKARRMAREHATDDRTFQREQKLAETLAAPPTQVPAPDVYAGDSTDTAYRFTSLQVAMTCLQQTRCPQCNGPLQIASKDQIGSEGGKVYEKFKLICKDNPRHPAVTVYIDVSLEPFMGPVAPKLGPILSRAGKERAQEPRSTRKVSYPAKREKRVFAIIQTIITILLIVGVSTVSALIAWGGFSLLGLPSPFWRVLLGNIAGLAVGFVVYLVGQFLASLPAVLKNRQVKPTPLQTILLTLLGVAAGATIGVLVGSWAGGASLLILLAIFWVMNRLQKKPA